MESKYGVKKNLPSRRYVSEKERTQAILGNFNFIGSNGEKLIKSIIKDDITLKKMISLAEKFSKASGKPVDRAYKRQKFLMYKYFDDNYDEFQKLVPHVSAQYEKDPNP